MTNQVVYFVEDAMPQPHPGATLPEVTHHVAELAGERLHFVSAGSQGSPVLLVHGFPESWWAFRGVIPALAGEHRVIAVDLPGFGDSSHHREVDYSSRFAAECLSQLIEQLDLGPVHLAGQDIGGVSCFRLAAGHPELVASYAAIETSLPGFGLEALADVTHGGSWHIGVIAAPGIAEMLLSGRERAFLSDFAVPAMSADPRAVSDADLAEFTRVYAQPDGFVGARGLYASMLVEGEEIREIATAATLAMPVLSVAAGTGPMTHETMRAVARDVREADLARIGHLAALEDPEALARALAGFYRELEA